MDCKYGKRYVHKQNVMKNNFIFTCSVHLYIVNPEDLISVRTYV